MKIGILTFHHTTNYGANLQAYALSQVLRRQGHQVEVIDYRPPAAVRKYRRAKIRWYSPFGGIMKYWRTQRFIKRHLPLGRRRYLSREELDGVPDLYEAIICGSDQIWDTSTFRRYDPAFFLDFVKDDRCRRVSYAASFGATRALGDRAESIRDLIRRFDHVSVRDENSRQILERECGVRAAVVLDPTLLGDYREIRRDPRRRGEYLLLYGKLDPDRERYLAAMARHRGLPIVSVGSWSRVADTCRIGAGPGECVGYFANARAVCTSFFHGILLSIAFRRDFTVLPDPGRSVKIEDILGRLSLEDRLVRDPTDLDSVGDSARPIDYRAPEAKLEEEIGASLEFLRRSLGG